MRNLMLRAAGVALLVSGAATSAYATDPVAKWCQGVKIAAFPGGPQGGVFANNVYNGYRQAELDLGPSVTYYFSNWDPNTMLTQLNEAIATKVDGVAFMGHPGDDATDPLIDKAVAQGIIFTTANTALPKARRNIGPEGIGYVGAPNHAAGYALGAEAAKRANQGRRRSLRLGPQGSGRRSRLAHRRRDRGARKGRRQGDLSGDRHGDRRRSQRRHGDLRRRYESQSGRQGRRHRPRGPHLERRRLRSRGVAEAGSGAVRRFRHVAEYRAGDQGGLPEPGHRPAALPAGLLSRSSTSA